MSNLIWDFNAHQLVDKENYFAKRQQEEQQRLQAEEAKKIEMYNQGTKAIEVMNAVTGGIDKSQKAASYIADQYRLPATDTNFTKNLLKGLTVKGADYNDIQDLTAQQPQGMTDPSTGKLLSFAPQFGAVQHSQAELDEIEKINNASAWKYGKGIDLVTEGWELKREKNDPDAGEDLIAQGKKLIEDNASAMEKAHKFEETSGVMGTLKELGKAAIDPNFYKVNLASQGPSNLPLMAEGVVGGLGSNLLRGLGVGVTAASGGTGAPLGAGLVMAGNTLQAATIYDTTVKESKMEAAGVMQTVYEREIAGGATPEQALFTAQAAADKNYKANLAITGLSNIGEQLTMFGSAGKFLKGAKDVTKTIENGNKLAGIGIKAAKEVGRAGLTGLTEGGQELTQFGAQEWASGTPLNKVDWTSPEAIENFAAGAAMGLGGHAIGRTADAIRGEKQDNQDPENTIPPEDLAPETNRASAVDIKINVIKSLPDASISQVKARVDKHITDGKTPGEALDTTLTELSQIPEVQPIIESAIKNTTPSADNNIATPTGTQEIVYNNKGDALKIIETTPEFYVVENEAGERNLVAKSELTTTAPAPAQSAETTPVNVPGTENKPEVTVEQIESNQVKNEQLTPLSNEQIDTLAEKLPKLDQSQPIVQELTQEVKQEQVTRGEAANDEANVAGNVEGNVEPEKEPWQMTKAEYIQAAAEHTGHSAETPHISQGTFGNHWSKQHEGIVKKAATEGKAVPEEALKDYPDIKSSNQAETKINTGANLDEQAPANTEKSEPEQGQKAGHKEELEEEKPAESSNSQVEKAPEKPATIDIGDGLTLAKTKHTQTGKDMWVVKPPAGQKLSDADFKSLAARMKSLGGSKWSKFTKGFNFYEDPTDKLQPKAEIKKGDTVYDKDGRALTVTNPGNANTMRVQDQEGNQQVVKKDEVKAEKPAVKKNAKIAQGKTTTAKTERGTSVEVQYAVVGGDDLVASHSTELRENKDYPQELQPRDRGRVASELQITKIANNLEPEFLGESPKASEGAPIVGPDMVVESGNGRVIALKRVYEGNSENASKYKQWIEDNADKFGLKKEDIAGINNPVLVRIRQSDVDRASFVKEANEQATAAMSATEQGKADAEKLTPEMMAVFAPAEDGQILNRDNQFFVREFMAKIIGASEQGRYATSDGSISQEGVSRIRNAIFAKAYGNSETLEKLAESTDNNVKNITNAMLMAAPKMAALKNGIESGSFYSLDISNEIAAATNKLSQLREQGTDVSDYLNLENQDNLFGEKELSPLTKDILTLFDKYKRSSKNIAKILSDYVDGVVAAGSPGQGNLWGETKPPTKAEVLDASLKRMEGHNEQASLFGNETLYGQENRAVNERTGGETGPEAKTADSQEVKGDILKENHIAYNADNLLREGEKTNAGRKRLKAALVQLVLFEETDALSDSRGNVDRSGGIRTIGLAITRKAAKTGRIDLRGAKASTPEELATLAQVFRDPSYETFRIFYVKGDSIVGHEAVTSRLPGACALFATDKPRAIHAMKDRLKRLNADGYYLLHNHPSGHSILSKEDISATKYFASAVPGFKGHVVIDSNEYSYYHPEHTIQYSSGKTKLVPEDLRTEKIDFSKGKGDPLLTPTVDHPLLGQVVANNAELAQMAKRLQLSKDMTVLIYTDSPGYVRAIQEVPNGLFNDLGKATEYIRGRSREFGARQAFAITESADLWVNKARELVKKGVLQDAIRPIGSSYESAFNDYGVQYDASINSRGKWMGKDISKHGTKVQEASPKFKRYDADLKTASAELEETFMPAPEAMRRPDMQAADILANILTGRGITPYRKPIWSKGPSTLGMVYNGRIFLSNKSRKGAPFLYVANHEIFHALPEDVKQEVIDVAMEYSQNVEDMFNQLREKGYTDDEIWEEFAADLMGEISYDPGFWQKVREKSPVIIKAVVDIIDKIISKFREAVGTDESKLKYIKDLETFKDIVAGITAKHLQDKPRNLLDLRRADAFAAKLKTGESGKQTKAPEQGASLLSGIGTPKAKLKRSEPSGPKFTLPDEEVQGRVEKARGVPQEGVRERMKEVWDEIVRKTSRAFEHLPNGATYEELRHALLNLRKAKGIAADKTLKVLNDVTKPLNEYEYDVFSYKVIFDDLSHEVEEGHMLPFGLTEDNFEDIKNYIDEETSKLPKVQAAIKKRQRAWAEAKDQYVKAQRAVGFNVEDRMKKEDYYHHQVLEYANGKGVMGSGKRLRVQTGRGFLKQRGGSGYDINSDYLQAEFEVMAQMLVDSTTAKTVKVVKDNHDIVKELKREATKQNNEAMLKEFERLLEIMKDTETTPEQLYRRTLNKKQAKAFADLYALAAKGELPAGPDDKYQNLIDKMAGAYWEAKENKAEKAELPEGLKNQLFPYLNYLAGNEQTDSEQAKIVARTIFKGKAQKIKTIRNTLGKNYVTWEDLVPDGYTVWQPREGHMFFMANTIPEGISEQLFYGMMDEIGINAEMVKKQMVVGQKYPEAVIPDEVALTLEALYKDVKDASPFAKWMYFTPYRAWKQWQLISPRRNIKYNIRNTSGDLDAVLAGNPGALKPRLLAKAWRDLKVGFFSKDKEYSPELQDWFERGGFETLMQAQEINEINRNRQFKHLMESRNNASAREKMLKAPATLWNGYWDLARTTTDFREAFMRYACYLDYCEQMEKNNGKPKNFGASNREEVMALKDYKDRAAKLSNELLGAYDEVSVTGTWLADHMFPFWRWNEVNFVRYLKLVRNAYQDGQMLATVGRKAAGVAIRSPFIAYKIGMFVVKANALAAMITAWNMLFFGDEDKELPEDVRNRLHICFGRDKNGDVLYFSRLGALQDFADWFGLDTPFKTAQDYLNGRKTIKEIALDWAKGDANKLLNAITPFVKTPVELLTDRKFYPDVFEPMPIRDKWQYIADSFGLGNEYKSLAGKPNRGYADSLADLVIYKSDPYETAYYKNKENVIKFKKKIGTYNEGYSESARSGSLYNIKLAIRYGDREAADKYLAEYIANGGTAKGLAQSIKSLNPVYGLNDVQTEVYIKDYLDTEGKEDLAKAIEYYAKVVGGDMFEEEED